MKTINLFLIISIISILFSCKGKQGDPGPQGTAGTFNLNQFYGYTEGYIKGTATGKYNDSTAFSFNIDFEGNSYDTSQNCYYEVLSPDSTIIHIEKEYAGQGDPF